MQKRFLIRPCQFWQKIKGNGPERVSIFSLPNCPQNYEIREDGLTIWDTKTNTTFNQFKGEQIKTIEQAEKAIEFFEEISRQPYQRS